MPKLETPRSFVENNTGYGGKKFVQLMDAIEARDALKARCAELEAIPERLRKLDMSLCPEPHGEWSILDCGKKLQVIMTWNGNIWRE